MICFINRWATMSREIEISDSNATSFKNWTPTTLTNPENKTEREWHFCYEASTHRGFNLLLQQIWYWFIRLLSGHWKTVCERIPMPVTWRKTSLGKYMYTLFKLHNILSFVLFVSRSIVKGTLSFRLDEFARGTLWVYFYV